MECNEILRGYNGPINGRLMGHNPYANHGAGLCTPTFAQKSKIIQFCREIYQHHGELIWVMAAMSHWSLGNFSLPGWTFLWGNGL